MSSGELGFVRRVFPNRGGFVRRVFPGLGGFVRRVTWLVDRLEPRNCTNWQRTTDH